MAGELVSSFIEEGKVDTSRVYIAGLSMGGMGTYEMVQRHPDTFAAAIAICGAGSTEPVENYALKTRLMSTIGKYAKPNAIILSSSSGLLPTKIYSKCKNPERAMIGWDILDGLLLGHRQLDLTRSPFIEPSALDETLLKEAIFIPCTSDSNIKD